MDPIATSRAARPPVRLTRARRARGRLCCVGVGLATLLVAGNPAGARAQPGPEQVPTAAEALPADSIEGLPNTFASVETWRYPSGLIVYFADMPKAEQVFYRATLPVGSREDPEELEGLAHFVEHMLFTGPADVPADDFLRQAEDRGGSWNGSTNRNRTDYWLELPANEWRFGLEWFEDLMFGHDFSEEGVDEERGAVIMEGDLEPRTPLDYLGDWFGDPGWADLPGFWERELGIPTDRNSTLGSWESVHAAGVDDVQRFYDRWYGPQNITIAVFGPLDRETVRAWVDEHFGSVAPFGETATTAYEATPADRFRRVVSFSDRRGHGYELRHVVPDIGREDWLWATFLRGLLSEQLNDVLRFERRAAYGVGTSVSLFRGHMSVNVRGNFDPEQIVESRAFVDDFLLQLRRDEVDPELFEALRQRAIAPLLLNNQTPRALGSWVATRLYGHDVLGDEFIDPVGFARQASSAGLAAWMEEHIVPERTVMTLRRPRPVWDVVEMLSAGLVVMLTFGLMRRVLVRPLDVRRIEYARKVHWGPVPVLTGFMLGVAFLLLSINALSVVMERLRWVVVDPVDFYPLHAGWLFVFIGLATALLMLPTANVPRKLLLLDDHWRVKYLSYRSKPFDYAAIQQVEVRPFWRAVLDRDSWPCRILSWNPFGRGVHLRTARGSYYFRCRDDAEMVEELDGRRAGVERPASAGGGASAGGDASAGEDASAVPSSAARSTAVTPSSSG